MAEILAEPDSMIFCHFISTPLLTGTPFCNQSLLSNLELQLGKASSGQQLSDGFVD